MEWQTPIQQVDTKTGGHILQKLNRFIEMVYLFLITTLKGKIARIKLVQTVSQYMTQNLSITLSNLLGLTKSVMTSGLFSLETDKNQTIHS